ncbi:unnamed protein product [Cylindrotheca closterium]|uniref:Protein kinase domain-containing protein n=1 Tax=Cylindrotheca closterium TaxID=2856 RepID=A0AAD2G391_9STRA|nr:unnamed protein product [Cylindrotheca closterium]
MAGMKHKSKAHQEQVKSPIASETNGTSDWYSKTKTVRNPIKAGAYSPPNASSSTIRRSPISVMNHFQTRTRKQRQKLRNMSISPTNRRFILVFGFFVLAGLHTVIVTTQLQKYLKEDAANILQTSKASFKTSEMKSKEKIPTYRGLEEEAVEGKTPTYRGIDLDELERAAAEVEAAAKEIQKTTRKLTIDDLELGDYIDHGAINVVSRVTLPDWWWEQERANHEDKSTPLSTAKNSKYVVKLAAGDWRVELAKRECKALQKLNKKKQKVRELNIMPTLMIGPCNFTNPFHTDQQRPIPSSFPDKYEKQLRTEPEIVAIVVPFYDHHFLSKPSKWVENLDDVRYFLQTLLQTLAYAHSVGINNMDISGSNVKVDMYGRALILDWNANQANGQPIYDPLANTWITAPEGLLEQTGLDSPKNVLQESISGMDIWSVGVMLTNLVFDPCFFVNPRGLGLHHSQIPEDQQRTEFPKHYGLIKEMLMRLGGETRIPVGEGVFLDLAKLVGLSRPKVWKRKFDLPLYTTNSTCQETDFEMLEDASKDDLEQLHSVLKTIFKISPLNRPTAQDLLKHPFFQDKPKRKVVKPQPWNKEEVIYDLSLADLEVGDFIGNGMINIAAFVEFPDWWYRQHNVDKEKQKYVIKMAPGDKWYTSQGDRECDVLEKMNKNKTLARKHNILPNVFCMRRARNPFFRNPDRQLPPSFSFKHQKRLRKEHKMSAVVIPFFNLQRAEDYCEDLDDVRLFISSLLETLNYSHSLAINNFDLSSSNVKISPKGRAVVMDWNANKANGQDMYDPTANTKITAPEGLLEYGLTEEDRILQTSISAMDIWSVGTMLADLVFAPCWWISRDDIDVKHPNGIYHYDYIRAILMEIGGESVIPIGNNKTLDLANLVGLNRSDLLSRKFNLPIFDEDDRCKTKDFPMLKGVPKEEVDLVYSFLETSMKIALQERPTASALLKHPFLSTEKTKSSKAAKRVEGKSNAELAKIIADVPMQYLDASVEEYTAAEKKKVRELTVNDIEIGEFIGNGAINMVAVAILPDWWYKQKKINKNVLFVVKLAAGSDWLTKQADRECYVLEILSRDKKKAEEFGIIQTIFMSKKVPNPFRKKHIPSKFPKHMVKRLRNAKTVVAIVQPYMDLDYIHDLKQFNDIRYFIRSLLRVLDYAHSLGVNNFDLSDSNVRVDDDGEAVVMDWNANKKQGEDIFDPVANLWLTAPEGMIEHGPRGETIRQTSISAMDIWSVGIMLIFLMYQPCQWVNPEVSYLYDKYPRNYHLLREVVKNVGGETIIPIGNHQEMDLAELVGLRREDLLKKKWKMPLYDAEQDDTCDETDTDSYLKQYGAKSKDLEDMHHFLESMMKLSPAERPDAATLLKHPFMIFSYE